MIKILDEIRERVEAGKYEPNWKLKANLEASIDTDEIRKWETAFKADVLGKARKFKKDILNILDFELTIPTDHIVIDSNGWDGSKSFLREVLDSVDVELDKLGLNRYLVIRMWDCGNRDNYVHTIYGFIKDVHNYLIGSDEYYYNPDMAWKIYKGYESDDSVIGIWYKGKSYQLPTKERIV